MTLKDFIKTWFHINKEFLQSTKGSRTLNSLKIENVRGLYQEVHENAEPIFVLSTGRCGTKLLTKILNQYPNIKTSHSSSPEPTWHSKWAYDNRDNQSGNVSDAIDALRYEAIRDCFLLKKRYIETNNRITFFAPQLSKLYPKSKFIHLHRNPVDFVKSGIKRKWYSNNVLYDESRISGESMEQVNWNYFSQYEKIAWLWSSTNKFIDKFKLSLKSDRFFTIESESLFGRHSEIIDLMTFMGISNIRMEQINKIRKKPINTNTSKINNDLDKGQLLRINEIINN